MSNSSTSWQLRLRATAFYLGLQPIVLLVPQWRNDPFSRHHFRQAAALFAVFVILTALFLVTAIALSYLLIHHRGIYEDFQVERYTLGSLRKLYLAWAVFWVFGLGLGLAGSQRDMPLLPRLSNRPALWKGSSAILLVGYGTLLALIPVARHGEMLAPASNTSGAVHVLFEDNDAFPRWFFQLAFYPLTRRGTTLWGDGSVVIQKFDRDSVRRAVAEAEFIYMGTHGTTKGLMLPDGWLAPSDLASMDINPALQFVYLSGCDSGQQRNGWLEVFAPAEVITYDRLSAVLEHAWWLWFRAPDVLSRLHEESSS